MRPIPIAGSRPDKDARTARLSDPRPTGKHPGTCHSPGPPSGDPALAAACAPATRHSLPYSQVFSLQVQAPGAQHPIPGAGAAAPRAGRPGSARKPNRPADAGSGGRRGAAGGGESSVPTDPSTARVSTECTHGQRDVASPGQLAHTASGRWPARTPTRTAAEGREKNPILTYIIVYAYNIRQYTSKGSFLQLGALSLMTAKIQLKKYNPKFLKLE